jgi:endonuclease/exonuclease/phosphatase family metal-dependent hydrolase
MGRIDLHLAVLSRFPLRTGVRIALPKLAEPRWRQALNLKRALLALPVPVSDGSTLRLGNTHFSAFSRGDGTLDRQVAVTAAWLRRNDSFLLGGDMNLLPPGDSPSRLTRDRENYADVGNPIEKLTGEFRDVSGDSVADPAWRTYLPFGADAADRRLDYLFAGSRLEVIEACILTRHRDVSDHLPILARLRLKPRLKA